MAPSLPPRKPPTEPEGIRMTKKDKTKGDWAVGDPQKPIVFSDKIGDTKSVLDKANKEIEKERGVKMKPFVESYRTEKNENI